jgi:hypothetical protein
MFNLDSIKQIQILIALLIAYVPIVTISGFVEAWAVTLAGDDSAEDAGFLTLNPLRHIDPVGMFVLFLIEWGFGQRVPFNPANITAPWRNLKFAAVLFTRPLVHLILIMLSVVALTFFKTTSATALLIEPSSFKYSLYLVVISFLKLNITFFAIYSILGLATFLVEMLLPDVYSRSLSVNIVVAVVFPMILFLALQPYLHIFLGVLLKNAANLF